VPFPDFEYRPDTGRDGVTVEPLIRYRTDPSAKGRTHGEARLLTGGIQRIDGDGPMAELGDIDHAKCATGRVSACTTANAQA
jgi:hypothetical protein